jgi:signal transduction histidine kinase
MVGYILMKTQAARNLFEARDYESARAQIDMAVVASEELYGDAREAILALRAAESASDLMQALGDYVAHFEQLSGIQTRIESRGAAPTQLPPSVNIQLLRIVQEALTNVRKHAGARSVKIGVEWDEGLLRVCTEDDGKGFDPTHADGDDRPRFGLRTMQERANMIGGEVQVQSSAGSGTKVIVQVPLG